MAENPDHSWRLTLKRRLLVATAGFVLWSVAIEARLVYLQVIQHDKLVKEALDQQSYVIDLDHKRGDILDRHGNPLAYNVEAESVVANPRLVSNPEHLVERLCQALRDCDASDREKYIRNLKRTDETGRLRAFAWLKRKMLPEQAARVEALKLKAIDFRKETRRFYPNRDLAAHLIGHANGTGLSGIEAKFEWLIGGEPGSALIQVDRNGKPFSRFERPSPPGGTVVLTVDPYLQYVAERELAAGVKWSGAEGGSVIVLDSLTGEILAMANNPTFNPNNLRASTPEDRKNRAVQDVYEPGSTFKIVTAGAALEEKLFSPSDLINTSPGYLKFGPHIINEAKGHNYGTLSFEDVIVKSSNVGAIRVGQHLGPQILSSYVSRFGFGARSASKSDFGGESSGVVARSSELDDLTMASMSMGYHVSVTALQMAAAVNAIATGGELLQPRLVKGWVSNGVYTATQKTVVRRVLSTATATQLTTIMEDVVERGTAKGAQVEGYTIAGKTGTAAKVLENGKGYSSVDYNVSFAGFVPSRNPRFTILVVIDSPHAVSAYGGTVSAPVFQKIAAAALRHGGVPPTLNPPAPLIIERPDPRQQMVSGPAEPPVVTVADETSDSPVVFPNLVGMNARDAVRTMVRLGMSPKLHGAGHVVNQRPAAGSALDRADTPTLWLGRRLPADVSSGEAQPRSFNADGVARGRP